MSLVGTFTYTLPPWNTYLFDASAVSDTDGPIVGYDWYFDGGQKESGVRVAHTFPRSLVAQFTVTLAVTNNVGGVHFISQDILNQLPSPPICQFYHEIAAGGLPRAVIFDASASSNPPPGGPLSYVWNFDDGQKDSGVRVTHSFGIGLHSASCTVTNDDGDSQQGDEFMIVDFTVAAASGSPPSAVTLDASACNSFVNFYNWDFGDGQTGYGATVTHTYPVGTYTVTLYAIKLGIGGYYIARASRTFTIDSQGILPDPVTVAPPINQTVATSLAGASAFLYSENDPIQTGVAANTIVRRQAAVLQGQVTDPDGTPLWNVQVSVLGHPEFGQTRTRGDGRFDLAVNGGSLLTLNYAKAGYLPVHRQAQPRWQGYTALPPVVLLPLDTASTAIDLSSNAALQVARGSVQSDRHGTRQATLFFLKGTLATLVLPDGTEQAVQHLTVRATEYTVGDSGPAAMPAALPLTSWYTYAVEFSADEALAAGATMVRFNQPLICYLENFLNFPVGLNKGTAANPAFVPVSIPAGSYAREQAAWLPSQDGQVVQIIGVANGLAVLDTLGDGKTDNGAVLRITDDERQQLAALYPVGQSLWRVPIMHFTAEDLNGSMRLPGDPLALAPNQPEPLVGQTCPDPCQEQGSTIECQNQTLGEAVAIAGTPFSLHYKSDRVRGRKFANEMLVYLSGASVPVDLLRIDLEILVAGQYFAQTFPATPNQSYSYSWDGNDAYGRPLQGEQIATVRIGYVYSGVYTEPSKVQGGGGAIEVSFGQPSNSGLELTGDAARLELTLWQVFHLPLGAWNSLAQGLGAWTLNVHHAYDPTRGKLYLGNGQRYNAEVFDLATITTVAGRGHPNDQIGDGGPATDAELARPWGVATGPDGSLYIADLDHGRIRRVGPDGIITTVAGNGQPYDPTKLGDGSPATAVALAGPRGVAVGPEGSIYIPDDSGLVRRVGSEGIITTVAGGGQSGDPFHVGDGGPATAAVVDAFGVAVAPDGSFYIADNSRIRRVGPEGIITTVAGVGPPAMADGGDNGPATKASLDQATGVAVGPDGSFYILEQLRLKIRRVGPDGIITTVAGNGTQGGAGDGGPATAAQFNQPQGVAVGPDGSLYITDMGTLADGTGANRVRQVSPDGIIRTIAGIGLLGFRGDGGPAMAAQFNDPIGVAVGPDNYLYIADTYNHCVRRLAPVFPNLPLDEFLIPSEDGSEVYLFDGDGRHQSTQDALTGALRYRFSYDAAGRLATVTDGDNNVTTINYDANPPIIVGPYGHQTALAWDGNGYLARITNPASESVQCVYTPDGLLRTLTDPKHNLYQFFYQEPSGKTLGRLNEEMDPTGGKKTLTHTDQGPSYTVTLDTALLNERKYMVEYLPTGDLQYTNSCCSGLQTVSTKGRDGTTTTTTPDGTVTQQTLGPDPRWGMQAPLAQSLSITTPGKLSLTVTTDRLVTLSDPNNPLSLTQMSDTVTLNGLAYTRVYTAATKTMVSTTPMGLTITTTLNDQGRIAQRQRAVLFPVIYAYDPNGQLHTVTQGTGTDTRTVTLTYAPTGELQSITDPLNQTTTLKSDAVWRVRTQTLADNQSVIAYGYDANGNLKTITPPGRPDHTFTYTPVNLLETYTTPQVDAGKNQILYSYNLDRQLTSVGLQHPGDPQAEQLVGFGYENDLLKTLTIPQGQIVYDYHDPVTGNLTNNVYTITAPVLPTPGQSITLSYNYDGSLPLNETWAGPVAGSVARSYDNTFRISTFSVNGMNAISYQYDNDGRLFQAGDLTLGYDPQNAQHGLLNTTTLGKITDSRSYNGFGEPSGYTVTFDGNPLYQVIYSKRDALGRITVKQETIGGVTTVFGYSYWPVGSLYTVTKDGVAIESYTYDGNGNRLSATMGSNPAVTGNYDNQDRLTSYGTTTYGYTDAGNLLSKQTADGQLTTYEYTVLGALSSVTLPNGTKISYLIDGRNRRVGKLVNGVLVQGFLYQDGLRVIAELDGANKVVSRFVYASRSNVPEYMVKGAVTYRIISDHLGSPRLVVDVATGSIAQRIDYDAFGNITNDSNPGFQPFGFAGSLYDHDTVLARFGLRDYDAEVGRWTTKDPVGFMGKNTNLYGYVSNDPINSVDPVGAAILFLPPYSENFWVTARKYFADLSVDPNNAWYETAFYSFMGTFSALFVPENAGYTEAVLTLGLGCAMSTEGPTRIYSGQELFRSYDEPGPYHNFPGMFDETILQGTRTVVNENYVEYTQRGWVNNQEGTFEIGVKPSSSGNTEVVTHRFFRPDR